MQIAHRNASFSNCKYRYIFKYTSFNFNGDISIDKYIQISQSKYIFLVNISS